MHSPALYTNDEEVDIQIENKVRSTLLNNATHTCKLDAKVDTVNGRGNTILADVIVALFGGTVIYVYVQ